VYDTKTRFSSVNGNTDHNNMAVIHLSISIHNVAHLQKVVERIKQIHDIYAVRRVLN